MQRREEKKTSTRMSSAKQNEKKIYKQQEETHIDNNERQVCTNTEYQSKRAPITTSLKDLEHTFRLHGEHT